MKTVSLSRHKSLAYQTLKQQLQTGDLVLFSGTSWSSRLVQVFTLSRWSHIALVVRLPEYPDQLLLWEVTRASKLHDIQHGQSMDGVQLVNLDAKLASYQGQVAIRRLKTKLNEQQRLQHLRHLLAAWRHKPYCNIVRKNLYAWWHGNAASSIGHQGGFCSELIAEIYQRWQLLPADRPARYYVPQDFAPSAALKLVNGGLSPAWWLHY
ncbi:hypothetical protein [Agitococcus lubricus]|uniref:Permuted papain-like amidase YaeF/Yiix C92 family enzyme n=1 Tax=Agitococcus lubricus TaxID=1077255 RepID=A0A2T5J0R7_9GAMM|nr:hypothetical protein [Agitococcus lubricus]PTQ89986.1 hypothetical protein C8N29_10424 [Agitococcus lubricus]